MVERTKWEKDGRADKVGKGWQSEQSGERMVERTKWEKDGRADKVGKL
jgi:hypothetical protein